MPEPHPSRLAESIRRLSSLLPEAEIEQLLAIQSEPLPTGLRVNRLKRDPQSAIVEWRARYGWQLQPIPFCPTGWTLHSAEVSPGGTIEHRMGQFYLQDAASMAPVSLFDIGRTPRPLILDMAASPGGKTTHLVDRTQDKGFIIANDSSKGRIPALRAVLDAWGGINQVITQYPGEAFGTWFPETFDYVLLDAPCSMENLRPAPNHPLRETTRDERLRLQSRQTDLLASGLAALKTGGQLVYATCSLAPEEDEAVIDAVGKRFPGSFAIEDGSKKFHLRAPGVTAFNGQSYHPDLARTLRLWPHRTGMSGFFCALLTKTGPLPAAAGSPPVRDFARTDLEPVTHDHQAQIFDQMAEQFGLEMDPILSDYHLALYQRHEQRFLLPICYLENFITLPFVYIGMSLGRWLGDALEPTQAFISRFGSRFTRGRLTLDEGNVPQWVAGRDIRHPQTGLEPRGQYLLVTDPAGRNLGLGKLLPKRLRNMLAR